MSTIADYSGPLQDRENTISAEARRRICVAALLLFVVVAAICAARQDVRLGFDEIAHTSYVASIQTSGEMRPEFGDLRMLDPASFRFTSGKNYLNHPSAYYALLAHLGPRLEGHPRALIIFRLINVAIAAIGLAALLAVGIVAELPRSWLYAYIVPIVLIPVLARIAGSINNDNAAFAGGAIATLAALQFLATERSAALVAALCGVLIASWAKLTGVLLAGGMLGGVFLWLAWRRRLKARWIGLAALVMMLAVAPYVAFLVQYGSPTPNTAGQIAMLKTDAHSAGWDVAARLSPAAYAFHFVREFILDWMPTMNPRNPLIYAVLLIPTAAAFCAFAGVAASMRRIARRNEGAIDVVIVASALAFAVTFVIHVVFSYQRHLAYGWMMDAYPRYYLPLAAFMPLAALSLVAAIQRPRTRTLLVGFLIAGPFVSGLLGMLVK